MRRTWAPLLGTRLSFCPSEVSTEVPERPSDQKRSIASGTFYATLAFSVKLTHLVHLPHPPASFDLLVLSNELKTIRKVFEPEDAPSEPLTELLVDLQLFRLQAALDETGVTSSEATEEAWRAAACTSQFVPCSLIARSDGGCAQTSSSPRTRPTARNRFTSSWWSRSSTRSSWSSFAGAVSDDLPLCRSSAADSPLPQPTRSATPRSPTRSSRTSSPSSPSSSRLRGRFRSIRRSSAASSLSARSSSSLQPPTLTKSRGEDVGQRGEAGPRPRPFRLVSAVSPLALVALVCHPSLLFALTPHVRPTLAGVHRLAGSHPGEVRCALTLCWLHSRAGCGATQGQCRSSRSSVSLPTLVPVDLPLPLTSSGLGVDPPRSAQPARVAGPARHQAAAGLHQQRAAARRPVRPACTSHPRPDCH